MRRWAEQIVQKRKDVLQIGYFGSYARGDWGVGSDLDLVIVVQRSDRPRERRSLEWDTGALPVPADVLIYTEEEWAALNVKWRFPRMLLQETVWVYRRDKDPCS
ncbi:MAG: nucleotidyltransferase domain-containing protein [Chloroflexia bacterium]